MACSGSYLSACPRKYPYCILSVRGLESKRKKVGYPYAFVGLIMQIDFALEPERQRGLKPMEAIYQGCLIRFRPIMMTTMAALLGAVPIALGYGAGGEARQPLGLVVVGGLLFSQLVTLYLTPVFYTYMAAIQERLGGRKRTLKEEPVHGLVAGD